MDQRIILDQQAIKTLAAESRIAILKLLMQRRYTQSELATHLALAVPTVKEHLTHLETQGFVKTTSEGRKWKYYTITERGVALFDPDGQKVWILLAVTALTALGGLFGFLRQSLPATEKLMQGAPAADIAESTAMSLPVLEQQASTISPWVPFVLVLLILVLLTIYFWVRSRRNKRLLEEKIVTREAGDHP